MGTSDSSKTRGICAARKHSSLAHQLPSSSDISDNSASESPFHSEINDLYICCGDVNLSPLFALWLHCCIFAFRIACCFDLQLKMHLQRPFRRISYVSHILIKYGAIDHMRSKGEVVFEHISLFSEISNLCAVNLDSCSFALLCPIVI